MSHTVTVIKPFQHDGRIVQPGDVLEVSAVSAASMKYRGVAKLGGYRTAAMEPVSDVAVRDYVESVTESIEATHAVNSPMDPDAPSESIETPRRRRQYRRRDLTAEE